MKRKRYLQILGALLISAMANSQIYAAPVQNDKIIAVEETINAADTLVRTAEGLITGAKTSGVYRYLGVPYAETDELFAPAHPVKSWQGEYSTASAPLIYR